MHLIFKWLCFLRSWCHIIYYQLLSKISEFKNRYRYMYTWGFSRQEYWSQLPCPPPRDLPNPGVEPRSLKFRALASRFFITSATWEAHRMGISSVQFSSVARLCLTLCDPMNCITPGFPVHHQLPEFTQTHVHWVGDAIQPSHPLSSPFPPAFNLSQHQGLFNESLRIGWSKNWRFCFSIHPSNEYSGLISFRMNLFDFLIVQGTLLGSYSRNISTSLVYKF